MSEEIPKTKNYSEQRVHTLSIFKELSVELTTVSSDVDIWECCSKNLKKLPGVKYVWSSQYDEASRELNVAYIEFEQGLMEKIVKLLGKKPKELRMPIYENTYNEIVKSVVGTRKTLTEVTFGAIPRLVGAALQKLIGVDRFIGLAYVIEGKLYGTSLLAMRPDEPDPPFDLLESYVHLIAVSLRRRKADEELRKSKEAYRDLVENINDIVYSVNSNGIVLYVSPVVESILGYKPSDLTGKSFDNVICKEDLPELQRSFIDVLNNRLSPSEFRVINKAGKTHWMRSSSRPISEGKKVTGIRGVLFDIDEQKKAAAEKEKLHEQLMQSGKMAAVGQLAGGVAHEINNPMTVILGYIQIIAEKMDKENPSYEKLKIVEKEALRCKELVESLLIFSRTTVKTLLKQDINNLIKETIKIIEVHTKINNIKVEKIYGEGLPSVLVNKNQIQQVIVNLCKNAADAMPNGGKITITTSQKENYILIDIKDTGYGISEETKKHLFEPFFTTKEVGKGTGLGLSLCYEIITKHKGTIEVESTEGKGTVFHIKLPIQNEQFAGQK